MACLYKRWASGGVELRCWRLRNVVLCRTQITTVKAALQLRREARILRLILFHALKGDAAEEDGLARNGW
jgi:hypothetical protein